MTTQQWVNNFIKTMLGTIAALIVSVIIGLLIGNLDRNWEIAGLICGAISFLYLGYKFLPYDVKIGIKNWNKPHGYQEMIELAKDFMHKLNELENNMLQNKHIVVTDIFNNFKNNLPTKITKAKFGTILMGELKKLMVFVQNDLRQSFYQKLGDTDWLRDIASQDSNPVDLVIPAKLVQDMSEISKQYGLSSAKMTNFVHEIFHGNKPLEEISHRYGVPMEVVSYIVKNAEYKTNDLRKNIDDRIDKFFEDYMWSIIGDLTDQATLLGKEYGFEPPFTDEKKTKVRNGKS